MVVRFPDVDKAQERSRRREERRGGGRVACSALDRLSMMGLWISGREAQWAVGTQIWSAGKRSELELSTWAHKHPDTLKNGGSA